MMMTLKTARLWTVVAAAVLVAGTVSVVGSAGASQRGPAPWVFTLSSAL